MIDENIITPPEDNQDEVKDIKIVPDKEKKSPLNKILICLILVVGILLVLQLSNMNNIDGILEEETIPVINVPEVAELTPSLFESDTIMLDFSDITLRIETASILDYYRELTENVENFILVDDLMILPSENIFEMRFQDTATSIYFYDRVKDEQAYCTVMNAGGIIGTYLIPAKYYGNLYNIVYTADGVTEHTKGLLESQLEEVAKNANEVAINLDADHIITDRENQIKIFESKVKAKETASIVYSLNGEKLLICSYTNLRYYVYLTKLDGAIIQSAVYNHYGLRENDIITFYNEQTPIAEENFMMNDNGLFLRVS